MIAINRGKNSRRVKGTKDDGRLNQLRLVERRVNGVLETAEMQLGSHDLATVRALVRTLQEAEHALPLNSGLLTEVLLCLAVAKKVVAYLSKGRLLTMRIIVRNLVAQTGRTIRSMVRTVKAWKPKTSKACEGHCIERSGYQGQAQVRVLIAHGRWIVG